MKKTVLSLLFISAGILGLKAQHTITSANAPVPGDVEIQANDSTPIGFMPGNGGASQNWDYTGLQNMKQDTTKYVSPSATPKGSKFPSSTVAVYSPMTGAATYYETSVSAYKFSGGVSLLPNDTTPIVAKANPSRLVMKFPSTYHTAFKDSSRSKAQFSGATYGVDSIRIKNKTVVHDTIDGYGSVKNPQTTYATTLRVKTVTFSYDTVDIKTPLGFQNFRKTVTKTTQYKWFAQGKTFPVVTLTMDSLETRVTLAKYWVDPSIVTGIAQANVKTGVSLFPNPASDELTVATAGNADRLEVFDITGRSAGLYRFAGSTVLKLNTSEFSKGMYLYKLIDAKGGLIQAGRFTVVR